MPALSLQGVRVQGCLPAVQHGKRILWASRRFLSRPEEVSSGGTTKVLTGTLAVARVQEEEGAAGVVALLAVTAL